jgi:excisionase family DNA binding protein
MENIERSNFVRVNPEPLLTAAEVSYRLHLSRSCTYSLMQSGTIPTVRIGKSRRVRVEDLEAFIKHNLFTAYDFSIK